MAEHRPVRKPNVTLKELERLDWWLWSRLPLAELTDLSLQKKRAGAKSGPPQLDKNMQELQQITWAFHEEWNRRRQEAIRRQDSLELSKLYLLVQYSTTGICMRSAYRTNGREVVFDYSQSSGLPFQPERFRLSGEADPGDRWSGVDLPSAGSGSRPPREEAVYEVVLGDCIDQGLKLLVEDLSPVILNIADGQRPGGGYRQGSTGQEEDLFRRTDYCLSLDEEMQQQLTGKPLQWPKAAKPLHPQGTYGAIYSRQLVFRHGEAHGYELMSKTEVLAFLALAAPRRLAGSPEDSMTPEEELTIFKKVALACEVAAAKGHRAVVFGALGCGQGGHPTADVAMLFRAALSCFHGRFRKVVFTLQDEQQYESFARVFDEAGSGLLSQVPCLGLPPRVRRGSSSSHSCHLCPVAWAHIRSHRGSAAGWRDEECPWLRLGGQRATDFHRHFFHHPPLCEKAGHCEDSSADHQREFAHPPACPAGAACKDFSHAHRQARSHPGRRKAQPPPCAHGARCPHFLDRRHCSSWCHPFRPPCPGVHLCPVDPAKDAEHWQRFSHLCLAGEACDLLQARDPEHLSRYVHPDLSLLPERPACAAGQHCPEQSTAHRLRCAHPGELEQLLGLGPVPPRPSAPGPGCRSHEVLPCEVPRCPYRGVNNSTDFVENSDFLLQHMGGSRRALSEKALTEVAVWIGRLRPTHRCKIETFQSMLLLGALISTEVIDEICERGPEAVSRITHEISERCPVCRREFQKADRQGQACRQQLQKYLQLTAVAEFLKRSGSTVGLGHPFMKAHLEELEAVRRSLTSLGLEAGSLRAVHSVAERAAVACHEIKVKDLRGVRFSVDRHLQTHRSIFGLLGPHTGQYYGHICLVLKRDLLFHVDSSVLPNAATTLTSGETCTFRPWCPVNPSAAARGHNCKDCQKMGVESCEFRDENESVFHHSKLHPCVDQWQRILAAEMLCQARHLKYEVSLRGVQKMWYDRDSHAMLEVHLPSLIHFGCVETVVMTAEQRSLLSEQDWELLREHFGGKIPLECRELPRNDTHMFKPAFLQTSEFVEDAHPEQGHSGLCIRLPPYNFESRRIFPLPLSLSPGTHHLTLRANSGSTFSLVLAPSLAHLQDPRSAPGTDFVTVMVAAGSSPGRANLLIGSGLPQRPDLLQTNRGNAQPDGGFCCVQDFDEGSFQVGGYNSFDLQIAASGQILLGHYGVDTLLNRKAGVYSPATVSRAQRVYVGLLTLEKAVSFVDIMVSKSPPPAVLPLEHLVKLENTDGNTSHLHVPWNDGDRDDEDSYPAVASQSHVAPPVFRAASRSISAFMEMDMLQHMRHGPSMLARLATPLKAGLPSRRSSGRSEDSLPQGSETVPSSSSPLLPAPVQPDDPQHAQSSSSSSLLLGRSSDEGTSGNRAGSSTGRGQAEVGDDDPIPDIHASAVPHPDWAPDGEAGARVPSQQSSSKLRVPGLEETSRAKAWPRQFTPPSGRRSSQPRVPDSEGKVCPQVPPPGLAESCERHPLKLQEDKPTTGPPNSGLSRTTGEAGGEARGPGQSVKDVNSERSASGAWPGQQTTGSGFLHASGLWPRQNSGSNDGFSLADDGTPPSPMPDPPPSLPAGSPASQAGQANQAGQTSQASQASKATWHLPPTGPGGPSTSRSSSPTRRGLSPARRTTRSSLGASTGAFSGAPLTANRIGSAELMGAPDPVEAELQIHKGSHPQVAMVAPDPQDSELEVHKPLSYVFHGHCQALKVTL